MFNWRGYFPRLSYSAGAFYLLLVLLVVLKPLNSSGDSADNDSTVHVGVRLDAWLTSWILTPSLFVLPACMLALVRGRGRVVAALAGVFLCIFVYSHLVTLVAVFLLMDMRRYPLPRASFFGIPILSGLVPLRAFLGTCCFVTFLALALRAYIVLEKDGAFTVPAPQVKPRASPTLKSGAARPPMRSPYPDPGNALASLTPRHLTRNSATLNAGATQGPLGWSKVPSGTNNSFARGPLGNFDRYSPPVDDHIGHRSVQRRRALAEAAAAARVGAVDSSVSDASDSLAGEFSDDEDEGGGVVSRALADEIYQDAESDSDSVGEGVIAQGGAKLSTGRSRLPQDTVKAAARERANLLAAVAAAAVNKGLP